MPFDDGCRREADLFKELEDSDEARALRYAFFIEREVARLPDIPANTPVRDFTNAAVVGAGTMGGGIAMSFADFGFPVKIMDATPEALERGMQRIRDNYATSVRRGSLAEDEMQRRLARIEPVAGYEDIADCDLVIEAVFEEMDVKKPVFAKLDEVMKPGALLFSNTSALDIDQLADHDQAAAGRGGDALLQSGQRDEAAGGGARQGRPRRRRWQRRCRWAAGSASCRRWRATPMVSSPTVRARRSTPRW